MDAGAEITVGCVHTGKQTLPVGTLVEVLAGEDEFWHGEINGYNGAEPLVTYIERDEDGVYAYQDETYEAPKESINAFYLIKDKHSKRDAWKRMGFSYRGRHEIVSLDDVNSDESDDEWMPGKKTSNPDDDDATDESDDDDGESDDDAADDETDDDEEEAETDETDDDETDEDDDDESEDDGAKKGGKPAPPPKRLKGSARAARSR